MDTITSGPYQHIQSCVAAKLEGDRRGQFLWFRYAGANENGVGRLSMALKKRCAQRPAFPSLLAVVDRRYNPDSDRGEALLQWTLPEMYGANLIAVKLYWDYGLWYNPKPRPGLRHLATITDSSVREYWLRGLTRGGQYRIFWKAVSDVGESDLSDGDAW